MEQLKNKLNNKLNTTNACKKKIKMLIILGSLVPYFNKMAARMTEPAAGDST